MRREAPKGPPPRRRDEAEEPVRPPVDREQMKATCRALADLAYDVAMARHKAKRAAA